MKRAALGIVYGASDDKVLLVKRRDVALWVLPGGGVDPGETPEEAAVREIYEESGIRAKIVRHAAKLYPASFLSTRTDLFICQAESGNPQKSNESLESKYFPQDALPSTLFYIHRKWIEEVLQKKGEMIERPLVEVNPFAILSYVFRHPLRFFRFFLTRIGLPINRSDNSRKF